MGLQVHSVERPLDDPVVFAILARVLARVESMGLVANIERFGHLDEHVLRELLESVAESGIATRVLSGPRLSRLAEASDWADLLVAVDRVLEESPVPEREWDSLAPLLGPELLGELLGISPSSLRRYASGERDTPDEVADRLHYLALVVADLAGAYNEIGLRRWFSRPRAALRGRSPRQLLRRRWTSDHDGPRRVRALAGLLTGSPAT